MAAMSDWLEQRLASHIFGSGTFSKPSTLAIALTSSVPVDSHTGATLPELPSSGNYTRQTLAPSANNWKDPIGTDGVCENLADITFSTATSDWGWVSGVAILDSASYGAGNVLVHGALTVAKYITTGDQFRFASGDIDLTFA